MVPVSSQRTQKPLLLKNRTMYLGFVEGDLAKMEASMGVYVLEGAYLATWTT